jgi:WD40 repeat protein
LRFVSLEDFHEFTRELNFLEASSGAFSPDRKLFAIASQLGYVRIWDTATWLEQITLTGFLSEVRDLQFSPDGRRLATAGANPREAVKLWDTDNWLDVLTLESEGTAAHQGVAFSPDGNAIGVTESYGSLVLWRAPSWEEIEAAENSAGSSRQGVHTR